jgi:ribosomal protein S18 acetylase RimI-like enzyme
VFHELWCAVKGQADFAVQRWDAADVERLQNARALLERVGRRTRKRVLLRVAEDNSFGLLLTKRYALPLENALLLAATDVHAIRAKPLLNGYVVRPYRPGDEARYAAIHTACFNQEADAGGMAEWATSPHCEAFSAAFRGRPVGLFIAEARRGGRLGDFNLAVGEGHRGRGLGTALLATGMRSFRRRGVARVIADHWATNAQAVAFYRKHGFCAERVYNFFLARGRGLRTS